MAEVRHGVPPLSSDSNDAPEATAELRPRRSDVSLERRSRRAQPVDQGLDLRIQRAENVTPIAFRPGKATEVVLFVVELLAVAVGE